MVSTIAPTLMCNFGCDYCFQGAKKPCGNMTAEVQQAVMTMVERIAPSIKRLNMSLVRRRTVARLGRHRVLVQTPNHVLRTAEDRIRCRNRD